MFKIIDKYTKLVANRLKLVGFRLNKKGGRWKVEDDFKSLDQSPPPRQKSNGGRVGYGDKNDLPPATCHP